MSKSHPGSPAGATWPGRRARPTGGAGDNFLTLFEFAAQDLGACPIGDAQLDGYRIGLAVGPEHEDPADCGTWLASAEVVVERLLRRREDLADAAPGHLAKALGP